MEPSFPTEFHESVLEHPMKRRFSAPTLINLELTELCNVKCRHCYNFWRDDSMGVVSLDPVQIDLLLEKFVEAGIFHVIVTGGEPMASFELLEYTVNRLVEAEISLSCNSNLMLATPKNISRLADAGLDHILTSFPSPIATDCDFMMNKPGAFESVVRGISVTVKGGIRVSANMVITRRNMNDVYEAGRVLADLGVEKLFVTRSVPPTYADPAKESDYILEPEEQKKVLDDAIRAKEDFGIGIGTLVSYPLCFLGDLERYADFVGRGCPAQSGHRMSINASGNVHACVHEEESYGNIFETSISEIYQEKMKKWHDGSFHNPACFGCRYIDVCESGCSMSALAVNGDHSAKDPLFVGPNAFESHLDLGNESDIKHAFDKNLRFRVRPGIRFRKDDECWLVNVRWGNSFPVSERIGLFLSECLVQERDFSLDDFGADNWRKLFLLQYKGVIETISDDGVNAETEDLGLSLNIDAIGEEFLVRD